MNRNPVRTLSACAALFAAAAAHANLLSNGSFESGNFSPPSNATMSLAAGSTAIDSWLVNADVLAWIGTGNPWNLTANEGARFLDLTDYSFGAPFGGVSQTIATMAGATYKLSFDLGSSTQWGRPSAVQASAAGTLATFASPSTGGNNQWQNVSMEFVATASTTTISLRGATGQNYIGLDNADVEFVRGVPEPGTMVLSLIGLGGLVAARRFRPGD